MLEITSRLLHGIVSGLIIVRVLFFCRPLGNFSPAALTTSRHRVDNANIRSTCCIFLPKCTLMLLPRSISLSLDRVHQWRKILSQGRKFKLHCDRNGGVPTMTTRWSGQCVIAKKASYFFCVRVAATRLTATRKQCNTTHARPIRHDAGGIGRALAFALRACMPSLHNWGVKTRPEVW